MTAPERIYLQGTADAPDCEDPNSGVTWCWHQIDDTDVEYVRADIAARATAEQRSLGDVTGAMYRCRRCGESSEIQNFATLPKENSCCRQKPCARPGAGPCDMPAHATEEQSDVQTVSDNFSEYRRGLREAFNSINMINANRQGRTAEETCAYMVRSLADLVNGGGTRDIRALKSQQDAAIESKPAGQSVPVLPTHGSFHTGVLVKLLLDDAFEILRPNSPEDCPEEPWMHVELGKKYWGILTATPRSVESQRSGDGS